MTATVMTDQIACSVSWLNREIRSRKLVVDSSPLRTNPSVSETSV